MDVPEVEKLENSELVVELGFVNVASEDEAADNEAFAYVVGVEAEQGKVEFGDTNKAATEEELAHGLVGSPVLESDYVAVPQAEAAVQQVEVAVAG